MVQRLTTGRTLSTPYTHVDFYYSKIESLFQELKMGTRDDKDWPIYCSML